MIAVIFEVTPAAGCRQAYLAAAAQLRGHLDAIDGFISIERFQSLAQPDKLLSLSFWRDEKAVASWRNFELHRQIQEQGRTGMLAHYRLRVAAVMRDYGLHERSETPADSHLRHGP